MSWAHHPTWQWPSMTHRKQQSSSRSLTDCELMHIIIQHHPWGPFFVTSVSLSLKSWCTTPIKSHQLPLNPINSHWIPSTPMKSHQLPLPDPQGKHPILGDGRRGLKYPSWNGWNATSTRPWCPNLIDDFYGTLVFGTHIQTFRLMYTMVYRCVQLQTRCLQLPGQPGLDGRCVMLSLVIFAILQLILSTSEKVVLGKRSPLEKLQHTE